MVKIPSGSRDRLVSASLKPHVSSPSTITASPNPLSWLYVLESLFRGIGGPYVPGSSYSVSSPLNISAISAMEHSVLPAVLCTLLSYDATLSWLYFFLLGVPSQWPWWPLILPQTSPYLRTQAGCCGGGEQSGITQRGYLQTPETLAVTHCVVFSDTKFYFSDKKSA